jgi:hypothetical protein
VESVVRGTPRHFEQVNVLLKEAIALLTSMDMDIDNHKRVTAFFYVIPIQKNDVVLGRPWVDAEQVLMDPVKGELTLGTSGLVAKEYGRGKEIDLPGMMQTASRFEALARKVRRNRFTPREPAQIPAASLADIGKALALKKHSDSPQKLPEDCYDFLLLFDRVQLVRTSRATTAETGRWKKLFWANAVD